MNGCASTSTTPPPAAAAKQLVMPPKPYTYINISTCLMTPPFLVHLLLLLLLTLLLLPVGIDGQHTLIMDDPTDDDISAAAASQVIRQNRRQYGQDSQQIGSGGGRSRERERGRDRDYSPPARYPSSVGQSQQQGYMRVNRCYSCMSPLYEEFFRSGDNHLAKYFYNPKNFTHQCDEPLNPEGVGLVPCRAICLTLTQEFVVMGRKTGKRLTMRGCATSLSRFGFYNRTIALFDQYDMCREVLANELFRYDTDSQPLQVCSCLGDRCNGAAPFNRGALRLMWMTALIIIVMALAWPEMTILYHRPLLI